MGNSIYKGDDTSAFGNRFLEINIKNINDLVISKAVFKCGSIRKVFDNPQFPLCVNLTEAETKMLQPTNYCYLALFDEQGRKKTCEGTIRIDALNEVV